MSGKSSSCGCQWHSAESRAKIAKAQIKEGSALRKEFGHVRAGAVQRGHLFTLDFESFRNLSQMNCCYCGTAPARDVSTKHEMLLVNGIDRIDNNIGYDSANVASCCTTCNYMKRALGREEFLAHIERISMHQRRSRIAIA
jgi:hypothetical protein